LRRSYSDLNAAEVRDRLAPIARELPSVLQAQEYQRRLHTDRRGAGSEPERDAESPGSESAGQSGASEGRQPGEVARAVGGAWQSTTNGHEFRAAIELAGLDLARGDKRDAVIVGPDGRVHGLARLLRATVPGITAAQIRDRLGPVLDELPSVDDVIRRRAQADRQAGADRGGQGARDPEMPRDASARSTRDQRKRDAQRRRRDEEKAARGEILEHASKQMRAEYDRARAQHLSDIRARSGSGWRAERLNRSDELAALRATENRERTLIYRGMPRGLMRRAALALHQKLSSVSRARLREQQRSRWQATKGSAERPMTYMEYLRREAPSNDIARSLLRTQLQREQYRAAQRQRDEQVGKGHSNDGPTKARPDRGRSPSDQGSDR
jgi:hypothetical protein